MAQGAPISVQAAQEEHVPLHSRIWVSAADGACATLGGLATGGALTYFFTIWRGLDQNLAGIVWIIFGIWNAINDPLFGYLSDRTRHPLGRRIPYIRFGAPLYAAAFIACWINWPGTQTNQTWMAVQLLVLLFIIDTLYTAIATSLYIMPYEMAVSNKARGSIFVWKLVFAVFSTAIPLLLFNPIKPKPGEDATSFTWIMAGIGIAVGVVIFLSTFNYKEKHFQREEEQIPFFQSIKECFKNFSFIIFEVISFTVIFAQTGLMQGVFYYFDEIPIPAMLMYGALAVGIITGVLVFIRQRDLWGVKRCVQVFCLAFALGCFIMLLFGRSILLAPLGFFLIGIGFAGGMYLIPLMNGDVIDKDEEHTGLRREGMYAGVNSFITKPAISLAQAIFLWALKTSGYVQGAQPGTQSELAQAGILLGWMLAPALLLAISFAALHWYPLTGPAWNTVKKNLEQVHAEKERRFLIEKGYRVD